MSWRRCSRVRADESDWKLPERPEAESVSMTLLDTVLTVAALPLLVAYRETDLFNPVDPGKSANRVEPGQTVLKYQPMTREVKRGPRERSMKQLAR